MYRQGDLLFIPTNEVHGEKKQSLVVLGSSLTGHDHKLSVGEVYVNEEIRWQQMGNFYVDIPEGGADLLHPEHKTIHLPQGKYEVRRQREITGFVQD